MCVFVWSVCDFTVFTRNSLTVERRRKMSFWTRYQIRPPRRRCVQWCVRIVFHSFIFSFFSLAYAGDAAKLLATRLQGDEVAKTSLSVTISCALVSHTGDSYASTHTQAIEHSIKFERPKTYLCLNTLTYNALLCLFFYSIHHIVHACVVVGVAVCYQQYSVAKTSRRQHLPTEEHYIIVCKCVCVMKIRIFLSLLLWWQARHRSTIK